VVVRGTITGGNSGVACPGEVATGGFEVLYAPLVRPTGDPQTDGPGRGPGPVISAQGQAITVDMSGFNRPIAHGTIIDETHILSDRDAGLALAPEACATAAEQVVDVLVALNALDPAEIGLEGLVRRTGYVERQLRRWHAQVHARETAEHTSPQGLAILDEVHGLLARRVPAQGNGVVHGDFRPGSSTGNSRPPVTRWPTWAGWRQPGRTQAMRSRPPLRGRAPPPGSRRAPRW
jgi:hypothetical protein